MSDASSAVTYTSVYTYYEPWRYYGEDSAKTRPPRVIVYGYDGLSIQPVAPPSPDYVPRPEHPPSPEYAPLEDQPLPADASPIAASPDYVADFDPEEDPEDDQADYLADGGDGDDEPSDDDDDDTNDEDSEEELFEDEDDDKEEEEHLSPTDSYAVPIVDLVLPAGDIEALEADEPTHAPGSPIIIPLSQTCLHKARKTVRPELPMSASMEACIARHAALPSPPLLVPSLPLPLPSPLTTSLTDTGAPLGYRAAGIRMRALLPSTSLRTDIPEANMGPWKRACLTTPAPGFEIGKSFTAGYGITDMWDEIVNTLMEIAPTTFKGVNERVTELDTTVRQRTNEFEIRFEEAQDDRALLRARVNTLFRDRLDHCRTAMLIDREAIYARKAWAYTEDRSSAIAAYVRTLETQVAALIAQTSSPQTQLTTALGRIEILEARDPNPQRDRLSQAAAKMAPKKRTTRVTPANTPTLTTNITNAQLHALIDQGVAAALAERDADKSRIGDNSNDSGTGERRQMTTLQECIYTDFLKCQPMSFQGTEGVVGSALTWYNSHMRAVGQDVAYAMPWAALKRMTTDKYYPRERYISGLPDMIHGSVKASKAQSMQEAIEFATKMMDKKMLIHAERQAEHKKKFDDASRNNQHQQQPYKRKNVARAYTAGPGDKKPYGGTKPLCPKCNYHHNGPCAPECTNCKKIGHLARDC
nr:hypothetical protein [Tanacetum cinerariifolium]